MRKLFNIVLCLMLGLASFSSFALPTFAQEAPDYTTTSYEDWDFDDYDYDWNYDSTYSDVDATDLLVGTASLLFGGVVLFFSLGAGVLLYVYFSLALMTIAKKLDAENPWFAWIPFLNIILLFQLGNQNPLLLLLLLIPGVGALVVAVFSIIATMTICEKRGYDKLLGLLSLVPIANLVLMGVLAWGKKN